MDSKCPKCKIELHVKDTADGMLIVCPECGYTRECGIDETALLPVSVVKMALGEDDQGLELLNLMPRPAVLSSRFAVTLEVLSGKDRGIIYEVKKGRCTIGRQNADLIISDNRVSRRHSSIKIFDNGLVLLSDLASTNGTYIGGTAIAKKCLRDGDIFTIGTTKIKVKIEL